MLIKPIRSFNDLKSAKTRLATLITAPNPTAHDDEIEVLTTLIEQFEMKHANVDAPDPVSAIKFRMEEKGMTPRQLEPYIGSRARVSEVLSGKRELSLDMIRSLHEGLGIPYESLISGRRRNSDLDNISAPALRRLNGLGFQLKHSEISSFIATSLDREAPATLLRKTRTQRAASKTNQGALLLWQAAVLKKLKDDARLPAFDSKSFKSENLRQIARTSQKPQGPQRAIRRLNELGIAVIFMPALPGTFLDGAAMMSPSGRPVIALTLRHDRIDSFWFTLLHECAHVALHLGKEQRLFVDDMDIPSADRQEREADALARDSLIPPSILEQVTWSADTSYDELMILATRARVHPSIVAGRWQRDHQNYKKFSRMIERHTLAPLFIGTEDG